MKPCHPPTVPRSARAGRTSDARVEVRVVVLHVTCKTAVRNHIVN